MLIWGTGWYGGIFSGVGKGALAVRGRMDKAVLFWEEGFEANVHVGCILQLGFLGLERVSGGGEYVG